MIIKALVNSVVKVMEETNFLNLTAAVLKFIYNGNTVVSVIFLVF